MIKSIRNQNPKFPERKEQKIPLAGLKGSGHTLMNPEKILQKD
jgi:hypothetical protein